MPTLERLIDSNPRTDTGTLSFRSVAGRVNVAFLLFWVALALAAYFGMNALIKPQVARVSVANAGVAQIVIPRSRDGHYYVAGTINGHPTTFIVDTGASTVVINPALARAAGLGKGYPATFNTASGRAEGETVSRQRVSVGDLSVADVSVAVIDGLGEYSLLGQNVLRHLEVIQSADQMLLRAKALAPRGPG